MADVGLTYADGGRAMALGLVLMVAAGCARATPDRQPSATLAAADPIVISVVPGPKGPRVLARLAEPDLAGDSIRRASQAVRQIGRAVQAGAKDLPPSATVVTFELYGVDVDKFGKRTPARLFASDYDVNDLKSADYAKSGPARSLNMAIDLRIDHAGISPINSWCMRYPHVGTNFCEMAGAD
jgi:hypothetical protein